jgi:hypothetical protein
MSKPIQIYRFGLRSFYRVATAIKSASLAIPISDGIRHSSRLRRLQREKRRIYGIYDKRRSDQKQHKNDEELIDAINYEEMIEIELTDEEVNLLNSRRLIEQAERYDLPIPEFKREGGHWQESRFGDSWMLNRDARVELRSAIRKEQKERRELWQMKLVWVTALAGVIGTLTGLISAIHR